jgi:hypothetical protein
MVSEIEIGIVHIGVEEFVLRRGITILFGVMKSAFGSEQWTQQRKNYSSGLMKMTACENEHTVSALWLSYDTPRLYGPEPFRAVWNNAHWLRLLPRYISGLQLELIS